MLPKLSPFAIKESPNSPCVWVHSLCTNGETSALRCLTIRFCGHQSSSNVYRHKSPLFSNLFLPAPNLSKPNLFTATTGWAFLQHHITETHSCGRLASFTYYYDFQVLPHLLMTLFIFSTAWM